MALPDLIAEAVANVNRLNGGPVFDLSADANVGATLMLVQASADGYAALLAEGKKWGGNPESTMTAAYPKDTPKSPSKAPKPGLPLPSDLPPVPDLPSGAPIPVPLELPPVVSGGEVKTIPIGGESAPASSPGTPSPEDLAAQAAVTAALSADAEEAENWEEGEWEE